MCDKKNIAVYLSNPPVHKNYRTGVPENILTAYESLKSKYKTTVTIMDENDILAYPDSLFFDADHLNKYGSSKYTAQLLKIVKDQVRNKKR